MLVAAPYPSFEGPKIIAGIRKKDIIAPTPNIRPRLSGELLVKCGHEKNWWPRKVTVRGGHLVVSSRRTDDSLPTLRLPLRQLNLQAGPLVNSLALTKGSIIVLTIQTSTEQHFDLWVKAIAIELIRQTPLFAVKYLDILNLTEVSKNKEREGTNCSCTLQSEPIRNDDHQKSQTLTIDHIHPKDVTTPPTDSKTSTPKCQTSTTNCQTATSKCQVATSKCQVATSKCQVATSKCQVATSKCQVATNKCQATGKVVEEKTVETILKKCQNVETYVPVKEKLVLFESLCRLGRKVRSSEDVSYKTEVETKRARSMHDLSNVGPHVAVREICKYFENKTDVNEFKNIPRNVTRNRLVCSDSQLHSVKKFYQISSR